MTNIITTRAVMALTCVSLATLLAACGPGEPGYYNSQGKFVSTAYNPNNQPRPPVMGIAPADPYYDDDYDDYPRYTRRGYYDYNGYYIARDSGFKVPASMFPPRGMCRVWFVDRPADEQPGVESCNGIRGRVPAGAYVIYGG